MLMLLLSIISTPLFAQTVLDRKIYDEDGFLLKQPNLPSVDRTISSTTLNPTDTTTPEIVSTIDPKDVLKGEIASCFDYYKFGSINVSLSPDFESYESSGLPMIIRGSIKNDNKYPVTGLTIKARVIKNIPSPDYMRAENMILDEFDIVKDISIDGNKEFEVSTAYALPLNAPSGEYQILFYAVEQDRFNLAGLSFTNDIIASKFDFTVKGKNPNFTYLDQTKITVGGQPHNVMAFVTKHEPTANIPVNIPLNNPTSEDKEIQVTYSLYSWDAANPKNLISSFSEVVKVPAKSSKNLTYEIKAGNTPVYYLSISAEPYVELIAAKKDPSVFREKTISNIRLAVYGFSKPRINYIGVDSYPLKKDVESTLVTCFHNGSDVADLSKTKIETVLYDQNKKELSRIEYNGKIIPDISGLINKFKTNKDIFNFSVVTNMFAENGELIDTVEKNYNCKDINPEICPVGNPLYDALAKNMYLIISIIVLVVIILIVWIYKRRKNK